jgi:hypothetical protein
VPQPRATALYIGGQNRPAAKRGPQNKNETKREGRAGREKKVFFFSPLVSDSARISRFISAPHLSALFASPPAALPRPVSLLGLGFPPPGVALRLRPRRRVLACLPLSLSPLFRPSVGRLPGLVTWITEMEIL